MALYWKAENFLTGIDSIDQQHMTLFKALNDLHRSMELGTGKEELIKMIIFLEEYTITHFRDEEQLMMERHYPELDIQKQEHQQFLNDFNEFRQTMETEGTSMKLVLNVFSRLSNWLAEHISEKDRKMGEYIRQH